jgi:hypothetical protein
MSLAEVLPDVRSLSRDDKAQLLQLLTQELSATDPAALLTPGQSYPVWSPVNAFAAADTLLKVLDSERARP